MRKSARCCDPRTDERVASDSRVLRVLRARQVDKVQRAVDCCLPAALDLRAPTNINDRWTHGGCRVRSRTSRVTMSAAWLRELMSLSLCARTTRRAFPVATGDRDGGHCTTRQRGRKGGRAPICMASSTDLTSVSVTPMTLRARPVRERRRRGARPRLLVEVSGLLDLQVGVRVRLQVLTRAANESPARPSAAQRPSPTRSPGAHCCTPGGTTPPRATSRTSRAAAALRTAPERQPVCEHAAAARRVTHFEHARHEPAAFALGGAQHGERLARTRVAVGEDRGGIAGEQGTWSFDTALRRCTRSRGRQAGRSYPAPPAPRDRRRPFACSPRRRLRRTRPPVRAPISSGSREEKALCKQACLFQRLLLLALLLRTHNHHRSGVAVQPRAWRGAATRPQTSIVSTAILASTSRHRLCISFSSWVRRHAAHLSHVLSAFLAGPHAPW
jgi:hypothetical protein